MTPVLGTLIDYVVYIVHDIRKRQLFSNLLEDLKTLAETAHFPLEEQGKLMGRERYSM